MGQECEAHGVVYWTAAKDANQFQVRRPYSIRSKRGGGGGTGTGSMRSQLDECEKKVRERGCFMVCVCVCVLCVCLSEEDIGERG